MRIGIFDPYLDSLSGGEKYMLTIAACLSQNHELFVFWEDPNVLYSAEKRFGLDLSKVTIVKNIFSSGYSFVNRFIESKKYDAIFYLSDGSIPLLASKKLFLHFQFPVEWVKDDLKNKLKIKRITEVICNSYYTKGFIDKKFHIKSRIVYPPSSGEVKIKQTKKENLILTVGRFSLIDEKRTFKKQEVMIDGFRQMIDKGLKNWKLILVISFPLHDEEKAEFLERRAKGYPIQIIKNAANHELEDLYAKAKIYWHAAGYQEDLQKHPELAEHFGIATVQAMEQKSVPVVMDAGGQKEIVDEGKNGFLWTSLDELKEKTELLINDKKLWEDLSERAQEKVKSFSITRFCEEIERIIQ